MSKTEIIFLGLWVRIIMVRYLVFILKDESRSVFFSSMVFVAGLWYVYLLFWPLNEEVFLQQRHAPT